MIKPYAGWKNDETWSVASDIVDDLRVRDFGFELDDCPDALQEQMTAALRSFSFNFVATRPSAITPEELNVVDWDALAEMIIENDRDEYEWWGYDRWVRSEKFAQAESARLERLAGLI